MTSSEQELARVCFGLLGNKVKLTQGEKALLPKAQVVEDELLRAVRSSIKAGHDPLGEMFIAARDGKQRRKLGATYTPSAIIDAMLIWAKDQKAKPERIVDPGAGSGRFVLAAGKVFPKAKLVAVELDPLAALCLRATAKVLGIDKRLSVLVADYRACVISPVKGRTLFIGNPPYVRHHDIEAPWKAWFTTSARELGFKASGLAGLHVHFFVRTRQLARKGDYGCFITAAEWMDVNYGDVLRRMLADGLGGSAVHLIDPVAMPFERAMTTGAITCFHVGNRPDGIKLEKVKSLLSLNGLSGGKTIDWDDVAKIRKWSHLLTAPKKVSRGGVDVGALFRVHRGQVTGCNEVWIENAAAPPVPKQLLFKAVTRGRELLAAHNALTLQAPLRRVVDLPEDLTGLAPDEFEQVQQFLTWAKAHHAHLGYVARHRSPWWSVKLRTPAPILCSYMARRKPAFVLNAAGVRHLNIAHGLYPVQPMSSADLSLVAEYLNESIDVEHGRTYAGGLVKFEPGEVSRLVLPKLLTEQLGL